MQKIYCRSIRPDGYGEGVVPGMEEPRFDYDFPPDGPTDAMLASAQEDFKGRHDIWFDKLDSLPIYALIHPDLHKGKVGWVGECRERYEVNNYGEWDEVSKYGYDNQDGTVGRRIVLVPVEGKEVKCTCLEDNKLTQALCKIHGRQLAEASFPKQPADKAEEKEVDRYAHLKKRMREYFDNVSPEELVAKFEAMGYTFVELPKPTPVTGEAVDANTILLKHIGIAPAGNFYLIGHGVSIRDQVIKAMSEYASQCTAPLEARIRELEELLLEIDKSLYIGPDLDDTEILKWYIDVVTVIKDEIKSILPGASSSSQTT